MNDGHNHAWTHDHVYLGEHHSRAEARTRFVVYLTAAFMLIEIVAGFLFGSMALLADGVHMATHVGALGARNVLLQELLIRIDLDRKEVRDVQYPGQLPEVLPDPLLLSERISHACDSDD